MKESKKHERVGTPAVAVQRVVSQPELTTTIQLKIGSVVSEWKDAPKSAADKLLQEYFRLTVKHLTPRQKKVVDAVLHHCKCSKAQNEKVLAG